MFEIKGSPGGKRAGRRHHHFHYRLSTSNRWFAARYNVNNAWNFNGNNRNLNNNNVYNAYQCGAVSNLSFGMNMMSKAEFFEYLSGVMFGTRNNKRRGRESVAYEMNWPALLVRDMRARIDRTLRIDQNYAFLTSIPRWREIMATSFSGRIADNEICNVLIPLSEEVLSPYTYNNRVGKGSQAAINQVIENMAAASCGYTKPARLIKLDLKGYFPNALWSYAEKCLLDLLDRSSLDAERKNYIEWLIMIAVNCNPAEHCELRSPRYLWEEHIDPEKSMLRKPAGVGGAIGRWLWQVAMGLYINDDIEWLIDKGLLVVCFMDDIVIAVPEELHHYALGLIPELRVRLAAKNVRLNEKKFYDQPYQHGLEFLGSHIKPHRVHLNNSTYGRAVDVVRAANAEPDKYRNLDNFVQRMNSYIGLLKTRTDYERMMRLVDMIDDEWWRYLQWNEQRRCIGYRPGYTPNERLDRKYNLHLKHKRHDKRRNPDPQACAGGPHPRPEGEAEGLRLHRREDRNGRSDEGRICRRNRSGAGVAGRNQRSAGGNRAPRCA